MACECSEVNHKFVLAKDFNLIKKKTQNFQADSRFIHQLLFEKVGLSLMEKIAFIRKVHTSTRGVRLWCFSVFIDNGLTFDLDSNPPLIKIIIYNSCSQIIYLHLTPFLVSYSFTPSLCVSSFTASMNLFIILCPVYPLSKPSQDAFLIFPTNCSTWAKVLIFNLAILTELTPSVVTVNFCQELDHQASSSCGGAV